MAHSKIIFALIVFYAKLAISKDLHGWHDSAICGKEVSYRVSRYVPYYETYKKKKWGLFYDTDVRINYKLEYTTQWRVEKECCAGYKDVMGYCKPVCNPPCGNGFCLEPNECHCFSGYVISDPMSYNFMSPINTSNSSEENDFACVPDCEPPCKNGKCTEPNTCTCNDNYHVPPNHPDHLCEPICEDGLCDPDHGYCAAPNMCSCDYGYELSISNNTCSPVCHDSCVNGYCVEPDVCACNDGFERSGIFLSVCFPVCNPSCVNSKCTAPNVCECYPRYRSVSPHECEPICDNPCVNGECIGPNTCKCEDGYGLATSDFICEPLCSEICHNGTCTAPDECTCNEGYVRKFPDNPYNWRFYDDYPSETCEPDCGENCHTFGTCVAPGVCECSFGYQYRPNDTSENEYFESPSDCKPICSMTCVNGFCSSHETCSCKPGYVLEYPNGCGPYCSFGCGPHSSCTAPDTCSCDSGYELPKINPTDCMPICTEPCGNHSDCIVPNVCLCRPGYSPINGTTHCEPECLRGCVNGTCVEPDVCECREGHAPDSQLGSEVCLPICEESCVNGTCVAPDTCACDDGYHLSNETVCTPSCRGDCANGDCVSPHRCVCRRGYRFESNDKAIDGLCVNACQDRCNDHGECADDLGNCDCRSGWTGDRCQNVKYCFVVTTPADVKLLKIPLVTQIDSSMEEAFNVSESCSHCRENVNNTHLCFMDVRMNMSTENEFRPVVKCLINLDSPCHEAYVRKRVEKIVGISSGVGVLIIAIVAATAVLVYRKRRGSSDATPDFVYENRNARVSLLSEEDVHL